MKSIVNLFIVSALALAFNACILNGVTGSRNVTTEIRTIEYVFDKLDVSQGIEVILTQGNIVSVSIEADDNLHEILKTDVKDNVLKIYFSENVAQRKASKVYITMPILTSIHTSSGSSVIGKNTFKVENLTLNSSSGSEINVRINAQDVSANSSSGSDISIKGNCQFLTANSSSGSEINARELIAQEVKADASSGSDIEVYSIERFTGNASSGASIECDGTPKTTSIDKSSGGSVRVN